MLRWVEFMSGLALTLVVLADVFGTVIVPRPSYRGIRFGPMLGRTIAPLWHHASRLIPSARMRQGMRGGLGPMILVLSPALWVAALATGFALMLYSEPGNVALRRFEFSETLFQSALALSTLGMVHAEVAGWARAIVAVEGVVGFVIVSLVAAFLLAIQSALHRREVLVLTLAARAGRPPSALRLIEAAATHGEEQLAGLFARWELWTADVAQSHMSYPVLCRFRSLDENMEWLLCLGTLMESAALIVATDPAHFQRARQAAEFLLKTGDRACRELARVIGVRPVPAALALDDFVALRGYLERRGLAASVDIAAEHARLSILRTGFAPILSALAVRLEIAWPASVLKPVED